MQTTLHVHVGHYKTGTTALQAFLAENRERLLHAGLDYATLGLSLEKHNAFAVPLIYGQHRHGEILGHDDPAPPEEFWQRLLDYARASDADHVLISSEEFVRVGENEDCLAMLERVRLMAGDDVRIRVIAYLRSPGSHLESWYNQLVKLDRPIGHRAHAIAKEFDRVNVDYELALSPWVEVFGSGFVTVRAYDPSWRSSDALFRDFLGLIPFEAPTDLALPQSDANPRIDDRTLELVRVLNRLGLERPKIDAELERFAAYMSNRPADDTVTESEFDAARRESMRGLNWLAQLPDSNIDVRAFRADPPRPRPEWDDFSATVLEYALSELVALRNG